MNREIDVGKPGGWRHWLSGLGAALLDNALDGFQRRAVGHVAAFFKGFRQLLGFLAGYRLGNGVSGKFHGSGNELAALAINQADSSKYNARL